MMMKIYLSACLLLFFSSGEWLTNFDSAKESAEKRQKFILLNFSGSDWCAPCIKMRRGVFENESFLEFAEQNLVLLQADFPRMKKNHQSKEQVKHNEWLAEKYNPEGRFPFTVLIDPTGAVRKRWDGYSDQSAESFVTDLQALIEK